MAGSATAGDGRYDLMLLDLAMPAWTGRSRAGRGGGPEETRVVVATGLPDEERAGSQR